MSSFRLFTPDLFSRSQPIFEEVSAQRKEALSELFLNNFGKIDAIVNFIRQAGGLEINSSNFAVHTNQGPYLLKVHRDLNAQDREIIEDQSALVEWLRNSGQPVPAPLRGQTGDYLCSTGDGNWISAMSFVEGEYFTGRPQSIQAVGRAVGDFHAALLNVPKDFRLERQYPMLTDIDREVFRTVTASEDAALSKFSIQHRELLKRHQRLLSETWERVLDYYPQFSSSESGLVHIDLHPHNMLLRDNRLIAFLDFDSLMEGPLNMMLGFSCYKLLRQVLCVEGWIGDGLQRSHLVDEYLNAVVSRCDRFFTNPEQLALFAYTEVCRRIAFIFRLNLLENNSTWNDALPMQIMGLREIQWLFGESNKLKV
jgi:hypothetical protein